MSEWVSREEHNEFVKRMEDGIKRSDARLHALEERDKQLNKLAADLQSLARSVDSMVEIQEQYNERLNKLEDRDGEKWREISGYVITTLIGSVFTFVMMNIGV